MNIHIKFIIALITVVVSIMILTNKPIQDPIEVDMIECINESMNKSMNVSMNKSMNVSMNQFVNTEFNNFMAFLNEDTTNEHKYTSTYVCSHFSRDLSMNASKHNIDIGSVIVGNHPKFVGHDNHALNFFRYDDKIYFVEPQSDMISDIDTIYEEYKYIRLYPAGTTMPLTWNLNIMPTFTRNY